MKNEKSKNPKDGRPLKERESPLTVAPEKKKSEYQESKEPVKKDM